MQPLISPVDHESRSNRYRVGAADDAGTSEATPLLQRPALGEPARSHNYRLTAAIVGILLIVLVFGVVIGIYLLVIQHDSENPLSPIEIPSHLTRSTRKEKSQNGQPMFLPTAAKVVLVVQTDTGQCNSTVACEHLINEIKESSGGETPYNFLVSSDGKTFEELSWRRRSPLFPSYAAESIVLGFIGNFTEETPTEAQIVEANNFLTEAVNRSYLDGNYVIACKRTADFPKNLCSRLSAFSRVNVELSDVS